jgi:hypothetical protein
MPYSVSAWPTTWKLSKPLLMNIYLKTLSTDQCLWCATLCSLKSGQHLVTPLHTSKSELWTMRPTEESSRFIIGIAQMCRMREHLPVHIDQCQSRITLGNRQRSFHLA